MRQTPVALLTGAPGSGKTTLLDAALRSGALARTAVVVNDTGTAGAGSSPVPRLGEQVRILPGGCVCCEVRDDLEIALLRLVRGAAHGNIPPFEGVVIETGGFAEPVPLLELFAGSPALSAAFWVETVVAVVDATRGDATLAEAGAMYRQALLADRLLLTKWESAPAARLAALQARLGELNPYAEQNRAARGASERAWFRAARTQPPGRLQHVPPEWVRSAHDEAVQPFMLRWAGPRPLEEIGGWLHAIAQAHGPRVLRASGIAAVTGEMRSVGLQVVGPIVAPPAFLWRDVPASHIHFIARGLEPGDVRPPWPVMGELAVPLARPADGVYLR